MKDFSGKLAVITGGGTGMGRELAKQLVEQGCDVAFCDIIEENMNETLKQCQKLAPQGVTVTAHICDVADEDQIIRFRTEVEAAHDRGHINLLFNNAGIGGGGSFVNDTRENWERTFNICWNGVYLMTRVFMPLLLASEEGHIINTSSVNGFYAALGMGGPGVPHTAYSSAKFAVKGFTEALITDFRFNAPHLKASIVMPGYVGTDIFINSGKILSGFDPMKMSDEEVEAAQEGVSLGLVDLKGMSKQGVREALRDRGEDYRNNAPCSAAEAATIMLDGVREEKWRIFVGKDAHNLDRTIREVPEEAYDESILERLARNYEETYGKP
jgi:NAD(P)-dependent dehydrogenase (short-subunit alcohol dehydrogenase family)